MPATIFKARIGAALIVCALAARAPAVRASPLAPGQAAPELIAQSFKGEKFDLSTIHGKVVVLNFWASWCGPCRSEMPLLEALSREYGDRIVVVGLSADDPHERRAALQAAQAVSYITGMLSEAPRNGFGAPQALPLTYIIGASGTVSALLRSNQGAISAERLRAAVEAALADGPPVRAP
jgi:cytochrome c biogenesis protein CcmG/thiol:disulfide interchange protein DsbE